MIYLCNFVFFKFWIKKISKSDLPNNNKKNETKKSETKERNLKQILSMLKKYGI